MYYLTVATCICGEDLYIDDFIRIHEKLGVEAFIFYDRDGDNLTDKFKDRSNITVVKWPRPNTHHGSHLYTVQNFQGHSKWIAFIDCDQVLFPVQNKDLKETLKEFELYAHVQPVWQTFGSNNQSIKEAGSVYERFTRRAVDEEGINNHSQGVAQIDRIMPTLPPDPHRLNVNPGEISVDESCKKVGDHLTMTPHISPHTQNKLFVAHYILKSREEYSQKQNKLRSDTWTQMPDHFDDQNKYCNAVEDTRIKDFWQKNCKDI